jgi:Cu(I)/Ag(I) efflux system membrane protein CusA/SilA
MRYPRDLRIMAGLLPIMWSTGTGSEITQRIAVPMIGGMISSTLLTLIVIPAVFGIVRGFGLATDPRQDRSSTRQACCSDCKAPEERPAHGGSG